MESHNDWFPVFLTYNIGRKYVTKKFVRELQSQNYGKFYQSNLLETKELQDKDCSLEACDAV